MSPIKCFLRVWVVEDPLPQTADVVVALSMGAVQNRLSSGTCAFFEKALEVSKNYPEAVFAYLAFDPLGVGEVEIKKRLAPDALFAGDAVDSLEEAALVKLAFPAAKSIIVVTGECHSRRARLIWKKTFPETKISVVVVPAEKEVDKDNILTLLRRIDTCLVANVAGFIATWLIGLEGMKTLKVRQPKT